MTRTFEAFWADPRRHTHAFASKPAARAFVAERTGGHWRQAFLGGALRVGKTQLRRVLGLSHEYPVAPHG